MTTLPVTTNGNSPLTKNGEITSIPYFCPNCDAVVGEFVHVQEEVRLDAGGWLIADGKRYCHRCGRLVHFKPPRDTWPVLVARYLARLQPCQVGKAAG